MSNNEFYNQHLNMALTVFFGFVCAFVLIVFLTQKSTHEHACDRVLFVVNDYFNDAGEVKLEAVEEIILHSAFQAKDLNLQPSMYYSRAMSTEVWVQDEDGFDSILFEINYYENLFKIFYSRNNVTTFQLEQGDRVFFATRAIAQAIGNNVYLVKEGYYWDTGFGYGRLNDYIITALNNYSVPFETKTDFSFASNGDEQHQQIYTITDSRPCNPSDDFEEEIGRMISRSDGLELKGFKARSWCPESLSIE